MTDIFKTYGVPIILFLAWGCGTENVASQKSGVLVKTPVTLTKIAVQDICEEVKLSASSMYMKKAQVQANNTGYIQQVFVNIGDFVVVGSPLFTIVTKESDALKNFANSDSLFSWSGTLTVKTPTTGIVTSLLKFTGDYVAEGEPMATVSDQSSFVFVLNVPYELNRYVGIGSEYAISLSDSTEVKAKLISRLSFVDEISQTQGYLLKPLKAQQLPENLQGSINLAINSKSKVQVLDRAAIMSDEEMKKFWIMKLVDDSTAVKIPVQIGISTRNSLEIKSPHFDSLDRIVLTGNYGLPDTAFVSVSLTER